MVTYKLHKTCESAGTREEKVRSYKDWVKTRKVLQATFKLYKEHGWHKADLACVAHNMRDRYLNAIKSKLMIAVTRNDRRYAIQFRTDRPDDAMPRAKEHFRLRIHELRRHAKQINDPLRIKETGTIIQLYQTKVLSAHKLPVDTEKYVGIEIECVVPKTADYSKLMPFGKYVNVGEDGSIHCNDNTQDGKELRVLCKRPEVRSVVTGIMQALNDMGATVNKSCGLHVHLDQRGNLTPDVTYAKLVRSLNLLYTVVPKSRRDNNQYCSRNSTTTYSINGDRYRAINPTSMRRYNTLEVRLFGGTLNATKVINWVETLIAVSEGEVLNRCPKNFDTARKYWKLSDENIAWLKARQEKFSKLNALAPQTESETENSTPVIMTDEATGDPVDYQEETCAECRELPNDCACSEFVAA